MAERESLSKLKDAIARPVEPEYGPKGFYNSGSTVLNLAASGRGRGGGWAKGRFVNLVGDGSSGKTLLALECIAHAMAKDPNLLVRYDNGEEVMDFNIRGMFGLPESIFLDRPSVTIEDFGRNLKSAISEAKGNPLIYVLDSLDSISSEDEIARFMANMDKKAKKTKATDDDEEDKKKGSYNLERQIYLSQFFRIYVVNNMKDNVTLIIISQVRTNIGVMFGEKLYRTGGKALDFYTHQVCWLREKEKMTRQHLGHKRVYGIRVAARIKRNKVAKPFREADFTILFDYGVDDLGSMLDFLYGPKAKEMEWEGETYTRATLITMIEDNDLEDRLREKVEEKWYAIEEAFKPDRKSKFPG